MYITFCQEPCHSACFTESWPTPMTSPEVVTSCVFTVSFCIYFSLLGQSDLCIVLFLLLLLLSTFALMACLWGWMLLLASLAYIVWNHYNLNWRRGTEWFNYNGFSGRSSCIILFLYLFIYFFNIWLLKLFFKPNYEKN